MRWSSRRDEAIISLPQMVSWLLDVQAASVMTPGSWYGGIAWDESMSQRAKEEVALPEEVTPSNCLPDGDQRNLRTMSWTAGSSSSAFPVLDQRLTAPAQSELSSRVATASISPVGSHAIVETREP